MAVAPSDEAGSSGRHLQAGVGWGSGGGGGWREGGNGGRGQGSAFSSRTCADFGPVRLQHVQL